MKRYLEIYFSLLAAGLCILAACAGPSKVTQARKPSAEITAPHKPRELIVYIPQTDDAAAAWMKLFTKHPNLRMVIAVSPRFHHFEKNPALKAQAVALQKSGRLEWALQLPNPPVLPLIVDTNSAKDTVAPGSPLPDPPFAYPDDVIQIVARAKADYFHTWNALPRGVVLPYGAASHSLLTLFDRLGFAWAIAALGAAPVDGAYRFGSMNLWDGASAAAPIGTAVKVWDDRVLRESGHGLATVDAWALELSAKGIDPILPSDAGLPTEPLPNDAAWARRTWNSKDWKNWIGAPGKNAAWEWLRRTREALEAYKNSGQASVKRLDMAFEEMYTAESANYFSSIGNETAGQAAAMDREHDFQATLSTVFRLIEKQPPDDLFSEGNRSTVPAPAMSSTTVSAEVLPDGREHVVMVDSAGDDHGDGRLPDPPGKKIPGIYDLRSLEVWASSDTVEWTVTLSNIAGSNLGSTRNPGPLIDIYVDLNSQPDVGTTTFLPMRGLSPASRDAWEYAISMSGTQASLFRTQSGGTYSLSDTFPLIVGGNSVRVVIPRSSMRGSPRRWAYQVLVMAFDSLSPEGSTQPYQPAEGEARLGRPASLGSGLAPVYDLLDPLEVPQAVLLDDIASGKRAEVPFVRVRTTK